MNEHLEKLRIYEKQLSALLDEFEVMEEIFFNKMKPETPIKQRIQAESSYAILSDVITKLRKIRHTIQYPVDKSKDIEEMTSNDKVSAIKWIRTLSVKELGMLLNPPMIATA